MCKCGSKRIAKVMGKTSDLCEYTKPDGSRSHGYVPYEKGIGGGDYLNFSYCLDCGRIQSDEFPIADPDGE